MGAVMACAVERKREAKAIEADCRVGSRYSDEGPRSPVPVFCCDSQLHYGEVTEGTRPLHLSSCPFDSDGTCYRV